MGLRLFVKSAGRSATPASPRTSALGAERDSTFTWANARRPVPRGWSATKLRGNVLPVSAKNPDAFFFSGFRVFAPVNVGTPPVFAECPADCESCANGETCTRCRQGLYLLGGRCHHVCPDDYEPSDKLMECTPQGGSRQEVIERRQNHARPKRSKLLCFSLLLVCHSIQCIARLANGASGAPALGPGEPADSSGARKPVRGRCSSTRHPSAIPVRRSRRSRIVWSRGANVPVRKTQSVGAADPWPRMPTADL